MEMTVGLYKVKRYGKHERMHVFFLEGKCYYSISSSPPLPIYRYQTDEIDTEIIRKFNPNENVSDTNVILTWADEDGDKYELKSSSMIVFKNKLRDNPDVYESINDLKYMRKE
jgi:hypothetical protein